jgi:hypothetical protein
MQKEFESEQMRPLAKAVTKTLEKVRGLVREQVRSAGSTRDRVADGSGCGSASRLSL